VSNSVFEPRYKIVILTCGVSFSPELAKVGRGARAVSAVMRRRTISSCTQKIQKTIFKVARCRRTSGWNIFFKDAKTFACTGDVGLLWRRLSNEERERYHNLASAANHARRRHVKSGLTDAVDHEVNPPSSQDDEDSSVSCL
jgi:hypothetical protein